MHKYILNTNHDVAINDEVILSKNSILQAIHYANEAILSLSATAQDYDINIFLVIIRVKSD